MNADPYLDPNNGIFHNRLGLTTSKSLFSAEADITAWKLMELQQIKISGNYDLEHLKRFHYYIFSELYSRAGEVRQIEIAKKEDFFCRTAVIPIYSKNLFSKLQGEKCLKGLQKEDFVNRLTYYLSEVNALHPFREGNGRTQRAFFQQLSSEAGYRLSFLRVSPKENKEAFRTAFRW